MRHDRRTPVRTFVLLLVSAVAVNGCGTAREEGAPAPSSASSPVRTAERTWNPVAPATFSSPAWQGLSERDRQLFTQLSAVYRTFATRAGEIWAPDFRPDRKPRVLSFVPTGGAKAAYAYAIGYPNPTELGRPTPLALPPELGLPPVVRIDSGPGVGTPGRCSVRHRPLDGNGAL